MTGILKIQSPNCPVPLRDYPHIVMGHGGGGRLSSELIEQVFLPAFGKVDGPLCDATALTYLDSVSLCLPTHSSFNRFSFLVEVSAIWLSMERSTTWR